jgi:hypothetical protein
VINRLNGGVKVLAQTMKRKKNTMKEMRPVDEL